MKKMLKIFTLLCSATLVLAGCDDFKPNWPMESPSEEELSIDTPWKDYTVPITAISFAKGENNIELIKGDRHEFSYSIEPRDANKEKLVWESENIYVATIENGVLTAVGGGTTYITVSSGNVSARAKINVTVPIEDFEVTSSIMDLDFGETAQIDVAFTPSDTTQNALTYEVVGASSVTVDENGVVSAPNGEADATIKVTNDLLNKVETVTVHVSDKWNYVSDISLTAPENLEVTKEGKITSQVIGVDPNVPATTLRNHSVIYSVKEGSEDLISVDENGKITALEVGDATLVASIIDERKSDEEPVTEEVTIHIFEISATDISLNIDETVELNNIEEGKLSLQLEPTYTLSDPSYNEPSRGHLVYSSSDSTAVKVSDDGLVEAVGLGVAGDGKAVITVSDTVYNVSDSINVHNTVYAKSITLTSSGSFYLDETVEITANVMPAKTSQPLVWEYDDSCGHTFSEDGNKLTITCNNLEHSVVVGAHVGDVVVSENAKIRLTPSERDVEFENGKAYIVGSSNYKTGVSKDAGAEGSWSRAKYAFVMRDKTGNVNAKYEYKSTIEFRKNDLWKIRENISDWRDVEGYGGPEEGRYKIGYYKTNEGAFASGQMSVTADDDKNILVNEAGKYDIYYAMYTNENPEGWYEVYVVEHGLRVSSSDVHAKMGTVSSITAYEWEGTLGVKDVDVEYISVEVDELNSLIKITPVKVGVTSFSVYDSNKMITINVKVSETPSAQETEFYIRGTAANGWNEVSEEYVLRASANEHNVGEILDVHLNVGEFKIAKANWADEIGWDYDNRSTVIGGAASKFSAGESDNNIKCNVEGYYNIYLTVDHYIAIESVGGDVPSELSSYYVRGTAVSGNWAAIPENQMALDSGNKAVIIGLSMNVGDFKIANADWSESWGYYYKNEDEATDHEVVQGGAKGNFSLSTGGDGNIHCDVAGVYNLYLTNNNYLYIESFVPETDEFALSATSATIDVGGSFVVTALNLTGNLSYEIKEGTASVVINGAEATISSSVAGEAKIAFSDDSDATPITFTLTVNEVVPVETTRLFIETKSWFNSGDEHEHVYVYTFVNGADPASYNADFPGEEATWKQDLKDGKKLFYFDIEETFDAFIVSKVVDGVKHFQTEDVLLNSSDPEVAAMNGDNCVCLIPDSTPESGDIPVEVGHYNYQLGLSVDNGTIAPNGETTTELVNYLGNVEWSVEPAGSASVTINNGVATITSSTVGESVITFSDESAYTASYTLTVSEAISSRRVYIETKSWFNSGANNEHVYVYAFKKGADPAVYNASFPGEEAEWVKDFTDGSGKKIFYFDVETPTYDCIVVSKVVDNEPIIYQTVDIMLNSTDPEVPAFNSNNCIYLNAESGSAEIPVGFYNYA